MDHGEGERLHAARRRRFWTILGLLALLGAVLGFVSGMLAARHDTGGDWSAAWTAATLIAVVLFIAIAVYGSWRFFRSVDELELADNLWASLFGFYTYGLMFPAWWALARIDRLPDPNQWVIYAASMIVATAAYFYRKWRLG